MDAGPPSKDVCRFESGRVPDILKTQQAGSVRETTVPTLQAIIADKFFAKLGESDVDGSKVEQLRTLFLAGKKVKADDLVKIFSLPPGSELK